MQYQSPTGEVFESRTDFEVWLTTELAKLGRVKTRVYDPDEAVRALLLCRGDKTETARRLGIGRTTLYRLLKAKEQQIHSQPLDSVLP